MTRRWVLVVVALLILDLAAIEFWRWRQEHRYDSVIREAAKRYGASPALVKAVIWRESRFNAHAVGGKGELGLMQLMEDAAGEWASAAHIPNFNYQDVLDPRTNAFAGTYYLARLLRRYPAVDNPVPYALADYNAGRGNVLRWMKGPASTNSAAFLAQMTFPGTRAYVDAIQRRRERYREEMP